MLNLQKYIDNHLIDFAKDNEYAVIEYTVGDGSTEEYVDADVIRDCIHDMFQKMEVHDFTELFEDDYDLSAELLDFITDTNIPQKDGNSFIERCVDKYHFMGR